ncbi:MAG: hypothetical protein HYU28_12075 [Actinobacteria bacterium]|nr:hypothetical protein [Actinomycetota bacterium]
MRRSAWFRLVTVVALIPLLAAACGEDDEEADEETTEETEAGEEAEEEAFDGVTLTASDYEFDAPEEIHASTVKVRGVNDGAVAHEFALVKLGDQTSKEFFEQLDTLFASFESGETAPMPDAAFNGAVGVSTVQPGGDPLESEISMSEGNWLLFCTLTDEETEGADEGEGGGGGDGEEPAGRAQEEEEDEGGEEEGGEEEAGLPPHYQLGMFKELTVTGDAEPSPPSGDATVTVVDYSFEGLDDLKAGTQTVVGLNSPDSEQVHHIVVTDFGEGKTDEEAETQFGECLALFFGGGEEEEGGGGGADDSAGRAQEEEEEQQEEGGPDCDNPDVGEIPLVSPGYGVTFDLSLESGHSYVFACFIPDREGGPPHAIAHDMFKAITIA